ncbi:hypothetical protein Mal4_19730 [Maioricimonas rarisocia]|uniref:Helix-turn-helix domain-containing protein n=1 Tax=Maioricimonas rarisocia TaxID=2528026 RepID=A0A517Z595_9PLAN|nr:helix-turn-helix domain-containing protein [Maioricimonas rarisocia]QDU37658.1 hypothetical protein Mal4_19730 [Maioricimonas rarisocia]
MSLPENLASRQRMILNTNLPMQQKLMLLSLALHIGNNEHTWASVETLAKSCSMKVRTAERQLTSLMDGGIVFSRRRTGQSALRSIIWSAVERELPPDARDSSNGPATSNGADPSPVADSDPPPVADKRTKRNNKRNTNGSRGGVSNGHPGTKQFCSDADFGGDDLLRRGMEVLVRMEADGLTRPEHRVQALTCWQYCRHAHARDDPGRLRHPAAFFVQCVKRRDWSRGSDEMEDRARQFLRKQERQAADAGKASEGRNGATESVAALANRFRAAPVPDDLVATEVA